MSKWSRREILSLPAKLALGGVATLATAEVAARWIGEQTPLPEFLPGKRLDQVNFNDKGDLQALINLFSKKPEAVYQFVELIKQNKLVFPLPHDLLLDVWEKRKRQEAFAGKRSYESPTISLHEGQLIYGSTVVGSGSGYKFGQENLFHHTLIQERKENLRYSISMVEFERYAPWLPEITDYAPYMKSTVPNEKLTIFKNVAVRQEYPVITGGSTPLYVTAVIETFQVVLPNYPHQMILEKIIVPDTPVLSHFKAYGDGVMNPVTQEKYRELFEKFEVLYQNAQK